MFTIRRGDERGHANHGWLESFHSFSFADYFDPQHMGFRSLRVINEDRVAPGQGFGTHSHHDMEIISYVLNGELEHKDSMGNGAILRPGEFQRITAGTGITHSEFNPSATESTHFYQIWLRPERLGIEPSYEQKQFAPNGRHNQWQLVASRDASAESLRVHQDAKIYLADLDAGLELTYAIPPARHLWLQVLRGVILAHGATLDAGDAAAWSDEASLRIEASEDSEVMLFELA